MNITVEQYIDYVGNVQAENGFNTFWLVTHYNGTVKPVFFDEPHNLPEGLTVSYNGNSEVVNDGTWLEVYKAIDSLLADSGLSFIEKLNFDDSRTNLVVSGS